MGVSKEQLVRRLREALDICEKDPDGFAETGASAALNLLAVARTDGSEDDVRRAEVLAAKRGYAGLCAFVAVAADIGAEAVFQDSENPDSPRPPSDLPRIH